MVIGPSLLIWCRDQKVTVGLCVVLNVSWSWSVQLPSFEIFCPIVLLLFHCLINLLMVIQCCELAGGFLRLISQNYWIFDPPFPFLTFPCPFPSLPLSFPSLSLPVTLPCPWSGVRECYPGKMFECSWVLAHLRYVKLIISRPYLVRSRYWYSVASVVVVCRRL